jgi:hypothetical protein
MQSNTSEVLMKKNHNKRNKASKSAEAKRARYYEYLAKICGSPSWGITDKYEERSMFNIK